MSYKAPIENKICGMLHDANDETVAFKDAAHDLTAYYELLARQAECGNTGHEHFCDCKYDCTRLTFCNKCGADLTKGAPHG